MHSFPRNEAQNVFSFLRAQGGSFFVSKCSATPAPTAATPLERDRVSEVQTSRDTLQGGRDGERQGPLEGGGGCSCDTPATPSKLQKEPRRGCSYTLERDRGRGCSVCATDSGSFVCGGGGGGKALMLKKLMCFFWPSLVAIQRNAGKNRASLGGPLQAVHREPLFPNV